MAAFLRQIGHILWAPIQLLITTFTAPEKLLELPRALVRVSLPAGIAIIVFVFLLVSVGLFYDAALRLDRGRIDVGPWWQKLPMILALTILIPIVVYFLIQAWLEGPPQEFQDIDKAWQAGLDQLQRNGLSLQDLPIHLIIGQADVAANRDFFDAAGLTFSIADVPSGDAPLHWYVAENAIYLVCSDAGCLSMVARKYRKLMDDRPMGDAETPAGLSSTSTHDPHRSFPINPNMTAMPEDQAAFVASNAQAMASGRRHSPDFGHMDLSGTLMTPPVTGSHQKNAESNARSIDLELGQEASTFGVRRLTYVCRLLVRARHPYVPINSVLVLLPKEVVEADSYKPDNEGHHLGQAFQRDTQTLLERLQLRCTVTVVVTGFEDTPGFCELMNRIPRNDRRNMRFGKGANNPWDPPSEGRIRAIFDYAIAAFEIWAYALFKNPEELGKPGNRRLYAMLCSIRRQLRKPLEQSLLLGLKCEQKAEEQALPLTGCYFCASGTIEAQQGFVRGIFQLLDKRQEDVEWSLDVQRAERRMYLLVYIGLALNAALLIGAIVVNFAGDLNR